MIVPTSFPQHRVILGPRSGAQDPDTQRVQDPALSAVRASGLACGGPE
jgi:hypothetical protein